MPENGLQERPRCVSLTLAGNPCNAPVTSLDGRFCVMHDRARRELVEDARRRGDRWLP